MENTELVSLLKTFSPAELKKLGEFIHSPYFNKISNAARLFDILKEHYPLFNISKHELYARLFPGEKYDDARLRVLFTRLLYNVQRFLAVNAYNTDEIKVRMDTGRELLKRGRKVLYNKNDAALEELFEERAPKDEAYYHEVYGRLLMANMPAGSFTAKAIDYRKQEEALLIYSISSLLKIHTTGMNTGTVLDMGEDVNRVEKILPLIQEFSHNPLVQVYYNIYLLLKEPDEEKHFFRQREILENSGSVLSRDEIFELYVVLLNYCVLKNMAGKKEYVKHKFSLYETMLKEGYFIGKDAAFPYAFFNNIVNSAIEVNKFSWAENFIEEYKDLVDAAMRDNIVYLCKAKLNYFRQEYGEALEALARVGNSEDVFYRIAIRDLQIKILFDMGHYENIFPVIDSYQHFLTNNRQLNKASKDNYKMYLRRLKQLVRLYTESTKLKPADLLYELKSSPSFVHKDWITGKAESLHP